MLSRPGFYNNNFYFTLNGGAQGYYRKRYGSGSATSFWQFAEEIEVLCDSADLTKLNQACAGFIAINGTDWSGNSFNDDLSWASMAFSRAYMLTGNSNYKTYAKNGFDVAYTGGWDTVNGGMWWNTSKISKPSCANGPGGLAAYLIYLNYGDSTYKTKAQAFHTWRSITFMTTAPAPSKEARTARITTPMIQAPLPALLITSGTPAEDRRRLNGCKIIGGPLQTGRPLASDPMPADSPALLPLDCKSRL